MVIPASSQTVFTGPTPNRQSNVGSFLGAFAGGLLKGKASKIDQQRALEAEARKATASNMLALIQQGEIELGPDGQLRPTGQGVRIKTAGDLKNIVDAQISINEQRTKTIGRVAKAASEIGTLVFDGLVERGVGQEIVGELLTELDGLMGEAAQTGDYTSVDQFVGAIGQQHNVDLTGAQKKVNNLRQQTQQADFTRILQESGTPAAQGLLGLAQQQQQPVNLETEEVPPPFTDPNGISRGDATVLGGGLLTGMLAAKNIAGIPVANPALKSVGAQAAKIPLGQAASFLGKKGAGLALGGLGRGVGALAGPIGAAAAGGATLGAMVQDQPVIADPLEAMFRNLILQRQVNSGQLGPQVQQQLINDQGLQQPRPAVTARFSQFGGGAL